MSEPLIDQYRQLHAARPDYGSGRDDAHIKAVILRELGDRVNDVRSALDYGCGKSLLLYDLFAEGRQATMILYDPAIPAVSGREWTQRKFHLITCNDVLEHIPEDELRGTLAEISGASSGKVFFTIHCGKASNRLPNGENCHVTIRPALWWMELLAEFWGVQKLLWAVWPRMIVMCDSNLLREDQSVTEVDRKRAEEINRKMNPVP